MLLEKVDRNVDRNHDEAKRILQERRKLLATLEKIKRRALMGDISSRNSELIYLIIV